MNHETFHLESLSSGSLLDTLPDGAYITDRERRILFWNRAAERITGWNRADVLGRSCSDNILCHVDKDGHSLCTGPNCPLYRAMQTGETNETPILVFAQSDSGRRVPVEVTVAPILDARNNIIGGVEIFRDMTPTMRDLNRARLIQKQALDFHPIQDPRLQIATLSLQHDLVGGDFLHIATLDADHYAVFIADVTGHGVAAALYTMQLRSFCEEHHDQLRNPSQFLSTINNQLHTLGNQNDYFATAAHCVINAQTGEILYSCAGHEAPLRLQKEGVVQPLTVKNPCLGLFPDSTFESTQTQLQPGDSLLIFTDGAIEIDDTDQRELGADGLGRLFQTLSGPDAEVTLALMEKAIMHYSRHVQLPDDMTLVCLLRSETA